MKISVSYSKQGLKTYKYPPFLYNQTDLSLMGPGEKGKRS